MKLKILFITAFLFLQGQFLFSQCISIELSVTWKMGPDIFNKDSVKSIPILNITYRNNCDTNYYFFKISPRKDGEPMVLCLAMVNYIDFDLLKRAMAHGNYINENFNVIMGKSPWYNSGWDIEGGSVDYIEKRSFSLGVERCLYEIYDYLYSKRHYKTTPQGFYNSFTPSFLTPENIISGFLQDQFVFLKPGEVHVDTYNLIGYKIVEGCFTFLIGQDEIKSYVIGSGEEKGTQEIELPEIVSEYLRYSGGFNTNKVTVCFGEK
ncbi:MAG: hypothetical protein FWD09_07165 [Lentimicrobiaceae bacterium]|nr:hypothetical protein [Lentimicrobiaceae bacterium]